MGFWQLRMIAENKQQNLSYDLHCHTVNSDGALAVDELLQRACDKGVDVLSITDHDTTAAYQQVSKLPDGLRLLPGIEFSSSWNKRSVHIVGLGLNLASESLAKAEYIQGQRRSERAGIIAERLAKKGFPGLLEGLNVDQPSQLCRPLFARQMVEKGWVKDVPQAFRKHLGNGKAGDVNVLWPSIEEVVGWIHAAGGVAVLAHPLQYQLTRTRLCRLLDEFVACKGEAIEVSSGASMSSAELDIVARLANDYGLSASRGSDFHAPQMHWRELGQSQPLPEACQPVWQSPGLQEKITSELSSRKQ